MPDRGKKYVGSLEDFSGKLDRVMARLGVENYQFDYTQSKDGCSCWVEMVYHGRAYRFENSRDKSKAAGRNLIYPSDLLASIVYSLEGLARAVEQEIFSLDMLMAGVPSLPAETAAPLEPFFLVLGFASRPETPEEVERQFKRMAKVAHPDAGGSSEQFQALITARDQAIDYFKED